MPSLVLELRGRRRHFQWPLHTKRHPLRRWQWTNRYNNIYTLFGLAVPFFFVYHQSTHKHSTTKQQPSQYRPMSMEWLVWPGLVRVRPRVPYICLSGWFCSVCCVLLVLLVVVRMYTHILLCHHSRAPRCPVVVRHHQRVVRRIVYSRIKRCTPLPMLCHHDDGWFGFICPLSSRRRDRSYIHCCLKSCSYECYTLHIIVIYVALHTERVCLYNVWWCFVYINIVIAIVSCIVALH